MSGDDQQHEINLKDQYENLYPLYKRLCREIIFTIKDEMKKARIKNRGISHRIKTFDSLYKKIIRKNISPNIFSNVQDIAGVRIICLYRSDLEKIGDLISKSFEVESMDTSRTRSETQFGYMADHYIVKLSRDCKGKRYDDLKSLNCEIQVRTVVMDAWASVSHHLAYKKETDIPSTLRKDFNAVSGLLYAADTHFELFKEGVKKSKEQLLNSLRSDNLDLGQEINLDSLGAYLRWRFPERERYSVSTYSDLVSDLNKFEYFTIGELDKVIQLTDKKANYLEQEEMHQRFYSDTGFVRICLMLYDNEYYEETKRLHWKRNKKLFELIDKMHTKTKNQQKAK
jgi:ppGpp synthetase/RelA/SpoT-type nucleotidyltranferase